METKAKLVKDLITSLGLSKEETLDVVLFLVSEKKLVLADFPKIQSKFKQVVELHEQLYKQFEELLQSDMSLFEQGSVSVEKTTEVKPKRKYTKRAKTTSKEEKPKRKYTKCKQQSSSETLVSESVDETSSSQEVLTDKVTRQEAPSVDISGKVFAPKESNKIQKKELLEQNRKETRPSKEEVESLAMGKVLRCKLLYQTKEGLHLSDRALNSVNPEGVQVPYRISGKFFILRIYDEAQGMTLKEAVAYAKKLPRLNDKPWMVLTPQQKESCLAVKDDLNEALKKVGGDLFEGGYLTNPPSYGRKGEKIRFAVEIEL